MNWDEAAQAMQLGVFGMVVSTSLFIDSLCVACRKLMSSSNTRTFLLIKQIPIMDNLCRQSFSRYIQLTLSIPGGTAMVGEMLYTTIRIDDNDFAYTDCPF